MIAFFRQLRLEAGNAQRQPLNRKTVPFLFLFFLCSTAAFAQHAARIKGIITDSTGVGIPGATVTEVGTKNAAQTLNDGTFTLTVSSRQSTLHVSSIGYADQETSAAQNSITVVLKMQNNNLGEIMVVGYGKQRKVDLTGAVAQISSEQLKDRPVPSVTQALQGELPGLQVVNSGGSPGREKTFIRIRGISSMNAGSANPLVIIDGVESALNDINPEDIATVSVLKDAASAAIYGSRAANGVILISTKKGKLGKPVVSYSGYVGWQDLVYKPKFENSWDYARLINEALVGEGGSPRYTDAEIQKFRDGSDPDHYPNSNYSKEMYRNNGLQHSNTLQVTGGTEAVKYFFSLGYLDQNGRIYSNGYQRLTPRFNLDAKINSWFSVGTNSSITYSTVLEPVWGGLVRQVHRIPSVTVFKYSNGMYGKGADGNPIAWTKDGGHNEANDTRIFQTFYAEATPVKDLKVRGSYTIDNYTHKQYNRRYDMYYGDGSSQKDNYGENWLNTDRTNTWIVQANYTKRIADKHTIAALAGFQYEYFIDRYNYLARSGFPNNNVEEINAADPSTAKAEGSTVEDKTASYFARLNYDYAGKYLLEANFRTDGSSRFAADNRWGYFPSVSAGWRISEEHFMKRARWINNLKLRASWGSLGNNLGVARYYYMQRIALGANYTFNNVLSTGATQTSPNNPDITWEKTNEVNLGLDANLFTHFNVTVDLYSRKTNNILSSIPVSREYGLDAPTVNAGALQNKGVELLLGYNNHAGAFEYTISGNVAYNYNVVTKYATPSIGDRVYQQGHKWGEFYGWDWTGFFATDDEAQKSPHQVGAPVKAGDLKFRDVSGPDGKPDGKIDGNDRVFLGGSDVPDWTFGLNLNGAYKGFDLGVFFQGAAKVKELMSGDAFYAFSNGGNIRTWQAEDHWTPEHMDAKYPRLTVNQNHNITTSGFSVKSRDYVRLKNLQLGYTFPAAATKRLGIQKIRVYVTASNLLTIQKNGYLQWDPETISYGNGLYGSDPHDVVPLMKVYAAGVNVTF
ncbi:SusC/RagA family TonB-linked outer membrane protein [Deminuibacter soli]|uniref:TonB-dependent receptor n=1 Tax=Deminuibacter soli TaxID=2291815 RepID=A0A3E1NGQ4_9BACT|nr:TonB-dependent receptor [Deminuibacter soli]RFM27031.1 TonB-dependent receptor [Deminuibacter soli]